MPTINKSFDRSIFITVILYKSSASACKWVRLSASEDAITWTGTQYIQNLDFNCMTYSKGNNGTFVAIGSLYENSKYVYYMTTFTDGVTWT